MNVSNREKREWVLLIFIVPVGVFLMLIAGQIAVHIDPNWAVNAGMESGLNPETAPKKQFGYVQPLSPDILTPMDWFSTFLTPNPDSSGAVVYPAFVVFEPSATPPLPTSPSPSLTSSPTVTETASPAVTESPLPPTPTDTPAVPPTKKPQDDEPTPEPPVATVIVIVTTTPETIDPALTRDASIVIATGAPDGSVDPIPSGRYVVVDVRGKPVKVENTPDGNYDLVFYEADDGSGVQIQLDRISIGISHASDGSTYWEVFNWGDGIPDTNTNVGALPSIPASENDNQAIAENKLYPNPGTGILIDVDTAASNPPPGSYDYIVVISPSAGGDPAQVDAIVVSEVPTP